MLHAEVLKAKNPLDLITGELICIIEDMLSG
jgi:hypothetical protein